MTVNVLGTVYAVEFRTQEADPALKNADGYFDSSVRRIIIRDYTQEEQKEPLSLCDLGAYKKKVLRHELVHAFLYESGLSINANGSDCWPANEEMVDWMAVQGPKLYAAWREADAL